MSEMISYVFRFPRDFIVTSPRLTLGSGNLESRLSAISGHQLGDILG